MIVEILRDQVNKDVVSTASLFLQYACAYAFMWDVVFHQLNLRVRGGETSGSNMGSGLVYSTASKSLAAIPSFEKQ
mgnify:CR=1 FL=1